MKKVINLYIFAGLLLTILLAVLVGTNAGLPNRLGNNINFAPNYGFHPSCDASYTNECSINNGAVKSIAVVGDSLAMSMIKGISAANSDTKVTQLTESSCTPFISHHTGKCSWLDDRIRSQAIESDKIVISSTFSQLRDVALFNAFSAELEKFAKNNNITLVIPAPYFKGTSRCIKKVVLFAQFEGCTFDSDAAANHDIREKLVEVTKQYAIPTLDLKNLMCKTGKCSPLDGKQPVLRDNLHFTVDAEKFVQSFFEGQLM